jgi:hypothetical protein
LESSDAAEVFLAQWLQTSSCEEGRNFKPEVKAWLHRYRRHVALADFVKKHGRLPQPTSADPAERTLAGWKNAVFYGSTSRPQEPWLLTAYEHLVRVMQPWQVRFEEVKTFYQAHGRTPVLRAKDPEERRLGIWLNNARNRPSEFVEEVRAWYEAHRKRGRRQQPKAIIST